MAPITKTLALAGAFFALTGYSAPVAKRAVVWETVTDVVWTTVQVTTTVYPSAPTATVVPMPVSAVSTTPAPVPTVDAPVKEVEKPAPTTSSTTTAAPAPAPTVQAETYSAPAPAPEPETSSVAPAPASAPTEEATTAAAPAPTTQANAAPAGNARSENTETTGSSGHIGVCSESAPCDGMITFYDTATTSTNPSSCGNTNDGTVENVLALPHGIMKDSDCGKTVTITYNGQTATGVVVDKCMGCDNGSVDLSRHLFGQLAPMDKGRVSGAKWYIH